MQILIERETNVEKLKLKYKTYSKKCCKTKIELYIYLTKQPLFMNKTLN